MEHVHVTCILDRSWFLLSWASYWELGLNLLFVCFLWRLPGRLCGEDLCKTLHSPLPYSMPASQLEKSCLVNLPAKWWKARNLEVQRVLTCRLLSAWLLSNPNSHANLRKQARKATKELGTPRTTESSAMGQRVIWIAPESWLLAFPFPRGFLDPSGLDCILKSECIANPVQKNCLHRSWHQLEEEVA